MPRAGGRGSARRYARPAGRLAYRALRAWRARYYELLDVFARDEFAPRLQKLFSEGQVAYTGIGVVPRTLEGRVSSLPSTMAAGGARRPARR